MESHVDELCTTKLTVLVMNSKGEIICNRVIVGSRCLILRVVWTWVKTRENGWLNIT